jgi:hypothetical protein
VAVCLNGLLVSAAEKRCVRVFFTTGNYAPPNKNKDNQLGVQNQIKFAELVAERNQRSVPEGKVDIGWTWKTYECSDKFY